VESYSVFLKRSAVKELEGIGTGADRRRIVDRIRALSEDPRPPGSRKLAGRRDRMRIRQGAVRLLSAVNDEDRIVTVVKIAHRKDVYERER